jgi:hypothetical protein
MQKASYGLLENIDDNSYTIWREGTGSLVEARVEELCSPKLCERIGHRLLHMEKSNKTHRLLFMAADTYEDFQRMPRIPFLLSSCFPCVRNRVHKVHVVSRPSVRLFTANFFALLPLQ